MRLQVGYISLSKHEKLFITKLTDFLSIIFNENGESSYLFWNQIPIRFHYTYELYANFDDLLIWWEKLAFESGGHYDWTMETDLFLADIQSEWKNGQLKIKSHWTEKRSHESLAKKLNEKNKIEMSVMDFLREWKMLMLQILNAVENSGVEFRDEKEKLKLIRLQKITKRIYSQGVLYTK